MFRPRKETEMEKRLKLRLSELLKINGDQRNQIAHLVNNSRRWAAKFANPLYSVPDKVIRKMADETAQYKEETRAEISKLQSRIAVLNERVLDLVEEKLTDKFGSDTGTAEIDFELAIDHINSVPTDDDRNAVSLELSEGWQKRFSKHSNSRD
ncbi:MAG: lysyl-tRNA synthetase class I [Arenicella sp.]|jgi:lysyl-tRNA synthetase class I